MDFPSYPDFFNMIIIIIIFEAIKVRYREVTEKSAPPIGLEVSGSGRGIFWYRVGKTCVNMIMSIIASTATVTIRIALFFNSLTYCRSFLIYNFILSFKFTGFKALHMHCKFESIESLFYIYR